MRAVDVATSDPGRYKPTGILHPMADGDLKVFTSWSGDFAREITRVIRDWLPQMLDRVDPWMSDVDIQAGTRALQVIEDKLNESEFGIIVVTTENQNSPWLNFEAGALSKRFEGRTSRVVPVLVNFDSFYQVDGPIRQFQGVMLTKQLESSDGSDTKTGDQERRVDKESVRELLKAINDVAGTKWPMVEARFEWSWNEFEANISDVMRKAGKQPEAPPVSSEALLKEVLDRISAMERRESQPYRAEPWTTSASRRTRVAEPEDDASTMLREVLENHNVAWNSFGYTNVPGMPVSAQINLKPGNKSEEVSQALLDLQSRGIDAVLESGGGV